MSEINLGNIEDVIGFDDYIEKRLAEKQKEIDKLKKENEKLRFLIDINSVSERTKLERQVDEQQDQISYWKHKVSSLLWILSQFDEEKVKKLLKELEE